MDWDIEPTAFSEFVTIERGNATNILFASNDGFAVGEPARQAAATPVTGERSTAARATTAPSSTSASTRSRPATAMTFNIFYGAAAPRPAPWRPRGVGAEAYSLGQPSTAGGPTLGTPNTFVFAFTGVGGGSRFSPSPSPGRRTPSAKATR